MTALLEVDDLHVAYGRVEALFGASLKVEGGQIVAVIGPNGAGKSTLLNAIAAISPSRGTIMLAGNPTDGMTTEELAAAGLSLVPEQRYLFGSMTVEDNLLLGGFLRRSRRRRAAAICWKMCSGDSRGCAERRGKHAATLSGGERQMLAIGRALMKKPKLLLLDEASLELAHLIVRDVFEVVRSLRAAGVSILLVEQNARMALRIADYGYVLETGEIVNEGSGEDLLNNRSIMDTYLGVDEWSMAADREAISTRDNTV